MGLFNLFKKKKKKTKHQIELVKQFNEGLILQVDNEIDNKRHFSMPVISGDLVDKTGEIPKPTKKIEGGYQRWPDQSKTA